MQFLVYCLDFFRQLILIFKSIKKKRKTKYIFFYIINLSLHLILRFHISTTTVKFYYMIFIPQL